MKENKYEILKRKKIRKLLLLKINDELKQISKTKSSIMINSKTIQELNQLYNQSNILLYEKSTIYSNYIRTEETIISKNISPINITKTLNKSQSKSKIKNKNKSKIDNKISQFGISSLEDDSMSPQINFFPKKIELGRKKFLDNKPKPRNNKSIVNLPEKRIDSEKGINESNILKSTKLGNGDLHLHKLIEKITSIKNNESTEGVILDNIKKLRNYCYQLRKRKKKVKRMSLYKNNSFRKKSRDKEKKLDLDYIKKRNTKIDKHPVKESFFSIQQKMEQNFKNKMNNRIEKSLSPTSPKFCIISKKSTSKVDKLNNNNKINPRPSTKNKNYSSIKSKDKIKKLQTSNEEDYELKNLNKSHKKKNKKIKTEEKYTEENVPYLNKIPKKFMRSTINDIKMKFDVYNDDNEKNKVKYNKIKYNNKKMFSKNMSIQIMNTKKHEAGLKYFNNLNIKKDKIELHDNLNLNLNKNKSTNKIKKLEQLKKENEKKNEENNEEIIKLKKLSIILDSRNSSKKKIIDSIDTRAYRFSNFTNYNSNEMNTSNQITTESNNNKSFVKKITKRGKD